MTGNVIAVNVVTGDLTYEGEYDPGFAPTDQGFLAWSFDPILATGNASPTAGQRSLVRVQIRYPATVSSVTYAVATAAVGATSGQNFFGLYGSDGTRLALTADQTTNFGGTGLVTAAFTAPAAVSPGFYWVALVANAGTSTPALARSGAGAVAGVSSAGLSAATARIAVNGTSQTSLAATLTPGSNTIATNGTYWVALS